MKLTNFQLALIAIFIVFIIIAVMIFSGAIKVGDKKTSDLYQGKVVVWGTLPSETVRDTFPGIESGYDNLTISYVERNPSTFEADLAEALASGVGPDLFFVSNDTLLSEANKLYVTPYESFPLRAYKSIYVDGADLFLNSKGVMAYPVTIDPLVLYWNKDLFNVAGLVSAPTAWEEMYKYAGLLSKRTATGVLTQSAISFGGYQNVTHAKDIIATLLIQSGDSIVRKNADDTYSSILGGYLPGTKIRPAESVLRFYTEFANPAGEYYSWSSSFAPSYNAFIAGDLAMYIGYSSEIYGIRERNPNLNFDVTRIPQLEGATTPLTFGKIYGVAVSKSSKNLASSLYVAQSLSGKDSVALISKDVSTLPIRRDLLSAPAEDPYLSSFYQSALLARSWYDPDANATNTVFSSMVSDTIAGFMSVGESVGKASEAIGRLLK